MCIRDSAHLILSQEPLGAAAVPLSGEIDRCLVVHSLYPLYDAPAQQVTEAGFPQNVW